MEQFSTPISRVYIEKLGRDMYVRGNPSCLASPIITIVGPRKPSLYGISCTRSIVQSLKGYNVTTCSGLALGIDSEVHKESLASGIHTIAIPGSSLSEEKLYPKTNYGIACKIVESGGCLLSLWETQEAAPWTFPCRNKILAEIADIVVVIEAKEKSGSLITATCARSLHKTVCAIPGNIDSELSFGTNQLIKDGAHCLTSYLDIVNLLSLDTIQTSKLRESGSILSLLNEPLHKDTLFKRTTYTIEKFNEEITILEIEKQITIDLFGVIRKI